MDERIKRTVTCGDLGAENVGQAVVLNGWVHRVRDHGGIKFIDLRDRYGVTQVVVDPDSEQALLEAAAELKFEYCVSVRGQVRPRPEEMVNPHMATGRIEIQAVEMTILSRSEVLPFMVDERCDAKEDLRLRYRYLDLRSFSMQRHIRLRHEVSFAVREYLVGRGFYEIETPTLIRSTPEGARDFLVPSRLQLGKVYALPQSPQLYKQLLMVSGFDRYFQIAHCFRDEDARGDRQLEHSQIDIEMSFVSKDDVFELIEGMLAHVFAKTLDKTLEIPFQRLPYREAMERFGTDKPDLRFALELQDFSGPAEKSSFQIFHKALEAGGAVRALVAPGCASYSRKQISELEETARVYGAKGLAWMKVTESGLEGGVARFFEQVRGEQGEPVAETVGAGAGDLVLMVGADFRTACTSLGAVRLRLADQLGLIPEGEFRFCWIVDFPLFEWSEDESRWEPAHHMFTMPQAAYVESLEKDPGAVKGDLYDLVANGVELASGSIRIHDPALQRRVFEIVGITEEEAERRFGFLLSAFQYGPPPHGGIAPGLDRMVMLMAGESTIRQVIAFPKNTVGVSPVDGAPAEADPAQLAELGLDLKPPKAKEGDSGGGQSASRNGG